MKAYPVALFAALLGVLLAAPPASAGSCPPATRALQYLARHTVANGGVATAQLSDEPGATEGWILGAAAAGFDPGTLRHGKATAYGFLAADVGFETQRAATAGKLILALAAGGRNPRSFAGARLAGTGGKLDSFYRPPGAFSSTSGGPVTDAFSQGLAMLAIAAAKAKAPAGTVTFVLQNQDADGGWNFFLDGHPTKAQLAADHADYTSDTNSTAMLVMALLAADRHSSSVRTAVDRALTWLAAQEGSSGGFPYQAGSPVDPDSDALVVEAIAAVGQDPSGGRWVRGGKNPYRNLLSFQQPDGGVYYAFPGESAAAATADEPFTTADVATALARQPLPVRGRFPAGAAVSCAARPAGASISAPLVIGAGVLVLVLVVGAALLVRTRGRPAHAR